MRPGNVVCFIPIPLHPSAEDNFFPASPFPAFVVGCLSPGAGCSLPISGTVGAGAIHLHGGQGDFVRCLCRGERTHCA